ncbi:hypothetical protein [Marinifilum sp. D737]|uniref:hypothetical protein n=1 Tax=Marinifilum sp. D737 TaxID=2969628 RepID=UPI002275286B|nr:hypothetical protein [Marinifilum sp. D737]MCY1635370.1 hypothetical protein [Marinifilum sp. D737]
MQQQTKNIQQVSAGCIVLAAYSDNKAVSAVSGVYGGCVLEFAASSCGVWGAMGPVGWMIGGGLAL